MFFIKDIGLNPESGWEVIMHGSGITERRKQRILQVLRNRQLDLTVVCENIHDPHNVSAILRSCDAAGVHRVHLLYTIESFPELGKKSSASAKKWIELVRHRSHLDLRGALKKEGLTIYATVVQENARSIFEIDWCKPSAIIVGNEHRGVSEEAASIADEYIVIPMMGMVQSLNVSVATAIILFEAVRQRLAAGRYPNPDLPSEWLQAKAQEWFQK
jgi:tRNA (guanosine-2'-O-)-methyltransferase